MQGSDNADTRQSSATAGRGRGNDELSRRGFLILSGTTAALATLSGAGVGLAEAAGATVLSGGFPRVLAFRQTEVLVRLRSYADWAPVFAQFNGIIGKALQEERTDFSGPQVVDYFTRFKQQYPGKLVLLHLNGRARRPSFETDGWSAGWWLYRAGSVLTAPIGPLDTEFPVAATSPFRLGTDMLGVAGDDVVVAPMGADGKPDFTAAEQVRVTGVAKRSSSLTVRRGQYATAASAFPAGSYLASHVYAGPWSAVDERVWLYNLSTSCPPDPTGRRAVDALLGQFAEWFGPAGVLAAFDGLELDVFQLRPENRGGIDADCDGVVDLAVVDGVDTYLQGQIQLSTGLRQILGPDRYLLTDGGIGQQPDTASVNGIELEGFPKVLDYDIRLWSQALMALELWRRFGANRRLRYPLFKFPPPHDYPVSFNRFRLAVSAALATDSVVSWSNEPGGSATIGLDLGVDLADVPNRVVVWDEFVAGTAGKPAWLGGPLAETAHLAERQPDALAGSGVAWSPALLATIVAPGVTLAVQPPKRSPILVASVAPGTAAVTFTLPGLALGGPDVVLALDLLADPRAAYPPTIGRPCTVTVVGTGSSLAQIITVPQQWFHAVLGFHSVGPGPIDVTFSVEGDSTLRLRGLRLFAAPDAITRAFTGGVMFANPSNAAVEFDVAGLFPGRTLARIIATADQDPITNNGSPLGATLVLGPLDALIVRSVAVQAQASTLST